MPNPIDQETRRRIFELLRQGKGVQEVADLCGVSRATVQRHQGLRAPDDITKNQRELLLKNPAVSQVFDYLKKRYGWMVAERYLQVMAKPPARGTKKRIEASIKNKARRKTQKKAQ